MMATNVATGLEIEGGNNIRPVTGEEWIALPIRPQDNAVQISGRRCEFEEIGRGGLRG